jgi:hypothetical protein
LPTSAFILFIPEIRTSTAGTAGFPLAIDWELIPKGEVIFAQNCQHCLPATARTYPLFLESG